MVDKKNIEEKVAPLTGHQKDWEKIKKQLDYLRETISNEGINEKNWDEIRKEFVEIWTPERVKNMTLEEYTDTNREYSFTYWIENVLNDFGNIHGSTSIKFGVYLGADGKYKWKKSLGNNENEAFKVVKEKLIEIINYSKEGKLEKIDEIWEISPMFKWKVAFLYNGEKNNILPIYSWEKLLEICESQEVKIEDDDSYPELYSKLLDKKREDINIFEYFYELWEQLGNVSKSTDAILLRYKYFDDTNNGEEVIIEHTEILEKKGYMLWGIFDKKLDSSNLKKGQYGFLLSTSPDGINILHMFEIESVIFRNDNAVDKSVKEYIPEYYRNNKEIKYYLKIEKEKFKQVPLSYLDLYSVVYKNGEISNDLRKSLEGQTSFFLLKLNRENINSLHEISFDKLSSKIVRKVNSIVGIFFKNYYGLKDIYVNLSSAKKTKYNFENNTISEINDSNKYNIFEEYGIKDLICFVGKNGVGKSRIIQAILNYINDWQKLSKGKDRNIDNENFEIFFEDEFGNLVKSNNKGYLFKEVSIQSFNKKNSINNDGNKRYNGVLDFSNMVNIFISDTIVNPSKLEDNKLFYFSNKITDEFSSYIYGGVLESNNYNRTQNIENNSIILSSILFNSKTREIFDKILKEIGIEFEFKYVFIKDKKNNNSNLDKLKSLKDLLINKRKIVFSKIEELKKEKKNYSHVCNNSCKELFKLLFKNEEINLNLGPQGLVSLFNKNFFILEGLFGYFLNKISIGKKVDINYLNEEFDKLKSNELDDLKYYELKKFFSLLIKSKIINLEFFDDDNNYLNLSSGEKNIVLIVAKIIYGYYYIRKNNINVYFDEPDTYLHPEWQRRFIYSLSKISLLIKKIRFDELFSNENTGITYYLTTHSPIMLSDIPRDNIIALEEGKIKHNLKQTFLNNLYSLYSDGFFVDSFVGEFAIKKYKEMLKEKGNINSFKDIIGDELVKRQFEIERNYFLKNQDEKN